jgi:hypothetical protein
VHKGKKVLVLLRDGTRLVDKFQAYTSTTIVLDALSSPDRARHVLLFVEHLMRALWIGKGLRSCHGQRALAGKDRARCLIKSVSPSSP